MSKHKWFWLQLFAEGGEGGGDGAATGVEAAVDAGQQRLRELGVPEDKLARRAQRNAAKEPVQRAPAKAQPQQTPEKEQVAAAQSPTEAEANQTPARMSWDEIMADPEYNRQMQSVIRARLRSAGAAQENLNRVMPALEVLARKHGMDPAKIDYEALAQKIHNEDEFYEDKALEMGVSVEAAKKIDQEERANARAQRQQALNLEEQRYEQHIQRMHQQAQALRQVFPDFDLRKELKNPAFARMTAPNMGISVEDAYYAVHRRELQNKTMQVAAQKTAQAISNSIQSGQRRPAESGTSGQAPSVTTFDYSKATTAERAAFKKYLREEAAKGRKVYPGTYRG